MAEEGQTLVQIRDLHFARGSKEIFRGLDIDIPRGKVTTILGPSGTGKTTLLKMIGGQLKPAKGSIVVDGLDVGKLSRRKLYDLRKRMGMLFQSGALLTDLSVFENVAYPLREHTDLPDSLISHLVLMRLHAVGLRGAKDLAPSELSGGMARRAALARALVFDPMMIMYDEPFIGQDPISMGVLLDLIRTVNTALGLTSVMVSHDLEEAMSISDYLVIISEGVVVESGPPEQLKSSSSEWVQQFLHGKSDGPVPFQLAAPDYGYWINIVAQLGRATIFLIQLISGVFSLIKRPSLLIKQLHASGVMTLSIVLVSGLFVGMVLALQAYNTLVDFGQEDRIGTLVALTLVRELGPVVTGLLFAGRAGSAMTAEIGLMKATEQLSGLEMMAVDPFKRVFAPRFLAGFIALPMLAAMFSAVGVMGGHLVGVEVLGVEANAYWSQMHNSVSFVNDVCNGLIKGLVFGFVVSWISIFQGADCIPTSEGVSSATTRTVVYSSLAILGLDFLLTAVMF